MENTHGLKDWKNTSNIENLVQMKPVNFWIRGIIEHVKDAANIGPYNTQWIFEIQEATEIRRLIWKANNDWFWPLDDPDRALYRQYKERGVIPDQDLGWTLEANKHEEARSSTSDRIF